MYLLYDDEGKIIGVSSQERTNSVKLTKLDVKITNGSIYDRERNVIITSDGNEINLDVEHGDILLDEV